MAGLNVNQINVAELYNRVINGTRRLRELVISALALIDAGPVPVETIVRHWQVPLQEALTAMPDVSGYAPDFVTRLNAYAQAQAEVPVSGWGVKYAALRAALISARDAAEAATPVDGSGNILWATWLSNQEAANTVANLSELRAALVTVKATLDA